MAIDEALPRAARLSDPELQSICARIAPALGRGTRLSEALAPYRSRLPDIVLPVLEVGEVAGTLDGAARRLERAFSYSAEQERRFRHSAFSPWSAILALSLYLAAYSVSESASAAIMTFLSCMFALTGYYVCGRLLCRLLFRWQALRLLVDEIKLVVPQVGVVVRNLAMARWGHSFVTLWASGVAVSYALEVSARSALNAYYERGLRRAARQTREGMSLRDSLAGIQFLPAHLLEMLATCEIAGSFGGSLDGFLTILEEDAFTRASQQFMGAVAAIQILVIVVAVVLGGATGLFGVAFSGIAFVLAGAIGALFAIVWFVCLIADRLTAS